MPAHSASREVLIIEDNQTVAQSLAALVQQAGYRPIVFHTGCTALGYTEHNRPCAIVVDIHLPDISGLIVSQRIRHCLGPDTPIIIISGDTSMENLNSLAHVGASHFFGKPLKAASLVQRLNELVA